MSDYDYRTALRHLSTLYGRLVRAEVAVASRSHARQALPAGSSRARVTTANAKWSIACEARDRIEKEIRALREEDGRLP